MKIHNYNELVNYFTIKKKNNYITYFFTIFILLFIFICLIKNNSNSLIIIFVFIFISYFNLKNILDDSKNYDICMQLLKEKKQTFIFELESIEYSNEKYIITENYFFDLQSFYIIKLDEVLLVYSKLKFSFSFFNTKISHYVYVISKDKTKKKILNWTTHSSEDINIYDFFTKRNNILIENTKENRQILIEKYNIKLSRSGKIL